MNGDADKIMEDFVAYPSQWRIALLGLPSVGFVALGLWMAGVIGPTPGSGRYSSGFLVAVGWSCVIFFGFCSGVIVRKFFASGAQLRIGPGGVWARSWSQQTIPWEEIVDVSIWSYRYNRSILLHLRDPSLFPASGAAAFMTKANQAITGGHVPITTAGTDRSFDEAIAAIARFRTGLARADDWAE